MYIAHNVLWNIDPLIFNENLQMLYKLGYQGAIVKLDNKNDIKSFFNSDFYPSKKISLNYPISIREFLNYRFPRYTLANMARRLPG